MAAEQDACYFLCRISANLLLALIYQNGILTGQICHCFSHPDVKISFKHSNLREIISDGNVHFDYAILTYVIHEVNEEERLDLLIEISGVADKIIIGDYLVPRPKGFGGFSSELIEFIAGKEHYRNYKSYIANGGIYYSGS